MTSQADEEVRLEAEGGLSAPTNVISDESLDCGCKQLRCPRLSKYATRPIYVTILCFIGIMQAAAHAYILTTSSTVSRRFNIDPYTMDWVLGIFHITTFVGGLAVAYWGDRIHKASWTGALCLLQAAAFITVLIPQFTHSNRTIEEPSDLNTTHMSIYAEDSPEICMKEGSARIISTENYTCYASLTMFGMAQLFSGLANIAYYALGVSYLIENTKRKNTVPYIGLIISMQVIGLLFGSLLAWSFLKIDADNFNPVESYREQIGAWWLGWPILAVLLAIPASLLAVFPRLLVSEVIERAAGQILNDSGTLPRNYNGSSTKVDSIYFLPSILRLVKNKILVLNVISAAFCAMALYNFILNENLYLESRFYAPRPNGLLLGFNDPIVSRAITNALKPLLAGFTIIISGLVIARARPQAIYLAGYNFIVIFLTGIIIFTLAFNSCDKKPIVGDKYSNLALINYCNLNCRCTKDADFRPVCSDTGVFTFYSACYAGCTSVNVTHGVRSYDGCTCSGHLASPGNFKATEGSCESNNCQPGWIIFEIVTTITYSLIASSIVGDFLINLRSSLNQDKALMIAFWLAWMAFFIQIPGKLIYNSFENSTCKHWGLDNQTCRFYSDSYASYLCFATASFLLIGAILKAIVCFVCKNLDLYDESNEKQEGEEMQEVTQIQSEPLLPAQNIPSADSGNVTAEIPNDPAPSVSLEPGPSEPKIEKVNAVQSILGETRQTQPGESKNVSFSELRPNSLYASVSKNNVVSHADSSSDESHVFGSPGSNISYKPLEMDSDTENYLYNFGPRSRQRIPSKTDENEPGNSQCSLPNPDNYEDPRRVRGYQLIVNKDSNLINESEQLKKTAGLSASKGDFNEIGIPIVKNNGSGYSRSNLPLGKSQDSIVMYQYDTKINQSKLKCAKYVMKTLDQTQVSSDVERMHHLLTEELVRPPSRDQASSGFGSLQNISDGTLRQSIRRQGSKESLTSKNSASTSESNSKSSAITTDL